MDKETWTKKCKFVSKFVRSCEFSLKREKGREREREECPARRSRSGFQFISGREETALLIASPSLIYRHGANTSLAKEFRSITRCRRPLIHGGRPDSRISFNQLRTVNRILLFVRSTFTIVSRHFLRNSSTNNFNNLEIFLFISQSIPSKNEFSISLCKFFFFFFFFGV